MCVWVCERERFPHLLSDPNESSPEILGLMMMTLITHLMVNHILHQKHLLQDGPAHNLRVT